MQPFRYFRPRSLAEASRMGLDHGPEASFLAGGTDLIVQMSKGRKRPAVVVDLKTAADLPAEVVPADGRLSIGARALMSDVLGHPEVRSRFPALCDALRVIGSVQIRNRATVPGNLCNASPAADSAPPLMVHDARVCVYNAASGRRTIPVAEFFRGPGRSALALGDIVEAVEIPFPPPGSGAAFLRLARRRGMDLTSVSAACLVEADGRARFAFGAAGPTPLRLSVETAVDGAAEAGLEERLSAFVRPISDIRAGAEYRRAMAGVLGLRALAIAQARRRHGR